MVSFLLPLAIGFGTGILSGFGIGGGSLLMLYLTMIALLEHRAAASINLLYFIACAPAALYMHVKNKLIERQALVWCVAGGVPACLLGAWFSGSIDTDWLRRGFGALLLYIGIKEILVKPQK